MLYTKDIQTTQTVVDHYECDVCRKKIKKVDVNIIEAVQRDYSIDEYHVCSLDCYLRMLRRLVNKKSTTEILANDTYADRYIRIDNKSIDMVYYMINNLHLTEKPIIQSLGYNIRDETDDLKDDLSFTVARFINRTKRLLKNATVNVEGIGPFTSYTVDLNFIPPTKCNPTYNEYKFDLNKKDNIIKLNFELINDLSDNIDVKYINISSENKYFTISNDNINYKNTVYFDDIQLKGRNVDDAKTTFDFTIQLNDDYIKPLLKSNKPVLDTIILKYNINCITYISKIIITRL